MGKVNRQPDLGLHSRLRPPFGDVGDHYGQAPRVIRHAFRDNGAKLTSGMPPLVDKLHVAPSRRDPDAAVKAVVVQALQALRPGVQLREWKFGSPEGVRASILYGVRVRASGRQRRASSCMLEGQVATQSADAAVSTYS